jgi:hypothetical protein
MSTRYVTTRKSKNPASRRISEAKLHGRASIDEKAAIPNDITEQNEKTGASADDVREKQRNNPDIGGNYWTAATSEALVSRRCLIAS